MLTYSQRAEYSLNPTGQRLLRLMDSKQSNLALAVDVIEKEKLLAIADQLGPEICLLKTHIDILVDFTPDVSLRLVELAEKHKFMIFEDRKFADIGNTVKWQYRDGIYRISDWADIVNAHIISGSGIIDGLKEVGLPKGKGLLLLAEMSSKGTLAKGAYTKRAVAWGEANAEFVIGFIALKKLSENPAFIHMTPGVQRVAGRDRLGQQYLTPEQVIGKNLSDVIIVGRGIYESSDPLQEAKIYRQLGWNTYLKRI